MASVALLHELQQLHLTLRLNQSAHEDVRDGHTQCDEEDNERSLDGPVEATVSSPITPSICMNPKSARYIITPGIMGMTAGMAMT